MREEYIKIISKELLITLLALSDIEIIDVRFTTNRELHIYVKSQKEGGECHQCGKDINDYYGTGQELVLRHLAVFEYKTYIHITPKRYCCKKCEGRPTTTQKLDWYKAKSKYTKAYEESILLSLINSTISDVCLKNDIGYDAVEGILNRYYKTTTDWTHIKALEVIGIDEISLKKGHKNFVTIISAYIEKKLTVLAVLEGRTKETVKAFFMSIPKKLRKTVTAVCADLCKSFINAAKEVFGRKTLVIADRFHIAKLYRDGLESLRKTEMKRLKKELSAQDYKQLEGVMWLLRKSFAELSDDERRILNRLFILSPKIREAYELCRRLTLIYNSQLKPGQAKRKMHGWMRRVKNTGLNCFDSFLKTLEANMDVIINYFVNRYTSGFVEGLNNKIKVIKRRCYGMTNLSRLFQRICLDLNGYSRLLKSTT